MTTPHLHPSQQGFSLLEVVIGAFLTTFLLILFYGSTTSVGAMTQTANLETRSRSTQQSILEHIRAELEQSGADSRIEVAADGTSVSYSKLIGAAALSGGVSGVWSQSYRIARNAAGSVARWEGAKQVSWGGGVEDLRFATNPTSSCITVTCVTRQNGKSVPRTMHCYPRN